MKELFVIAWRNLWRNKRRTVITIASVLFAVIISTLLSSVQNGSYNRFIQYAVECFSGHIQIQHKDYHKLKSIAHSFDDRKDFDEIQYVRNVKYVTKRFFANALASGKNISIPVYIQGVEPEKEEKMTKYSNRIKDGNDLISNPDGLVIGIGIAKILKLQPNDSIMISGQTLDNLPVSKKFIINGIISYPSEDLNKLMVFMDIDKSRQLFNATNRLTSVVITCHNNKIKKTAEILKDRYDKHRFKVLRWDEIQIPLMQVIRVDRASGTFVSFILYLVVSFGLFSTIMMLFIERKKEFIMMLSLGMKKRKLIITVLAEIIMISAISTLIGLVICTPLIIMFMNDPVSISNTEIQLMTDIGLQPFIAFSSSAFIFIKQAIIIFTITILLSIYPLYRISKLNTNQHF